MTKGIFNRSELTREEVEFPLPSLVIEDEDDVESDADDDDDDEGYIQ